MDALSGGLFLPIAAALNISLSNGVCRYSKSELTDFQRQDRYAEKYQGDWACLMLQDNFERDSYPECTPDVDKTFSGPITRKFQITGRLKFVGVWKKKYKYWISPASDDKIKVSLKVAFKNDAANAPEIIKAMQEKLNEAAVYWTKNSPNQKIEFEFHVVAKDKDPSVSVNLVSGVSRGPFDSEWSVDWDVHKLAHEAGHIMGLDDEYDQVKYSLDLGDYITRYQCNVKSIMCTAGVPQPYHYYLILRRRLCRSSEPLDSAL